MELLWRKTGQFLYRYHTGSDFPKEIEEELAALAVEEQKNETKQQKFEKPEK